MLRGFSAALGLLFVSGLAGGGMSGPAQAEVKTNIRYSGYPVYGLTTQEIWRDIGRKGPHQLERGLYAQAEAEIRFGWNVAFTSGKGSCRVKSAVVNVDVNILLPQWADQARGSPALQAAWKSYIAQVRKHEDYHKDIALTAARQLDRAIMAAPAHRTCRALERTIKAKTDGILRRERAQQAHFDRTDKPIMLTGGR
jgi:predicted secreted Zn-dependent protease